MGKIKEIIAACLDLLFPPCCSGCREILKTADLKLCKECYEQLQFITSPYCSCCGRIFQGGVENHLCGECLRNPWAFDKARSLFAYEEIIAGLIHRLKYAGDMNGLETFRWLSEQSDVLHDLDTPDFVIPVPLHTKRLRKRGFNQALVLVRSLFREERNKIRYDILIRNTDTPSQAGLSGVERRKNLKNAFVVTVPEEIAEAKILLFDDVFTTGTTVNECAKALKIAGCKSVEILTICRADKTLA